MKRWPQKKTLKIKFYQKDAKILRKIKRVLKIKASLQKKTNLSWKLKENRGGLKEARTIF